MKMKSIWTILVLLSCYSFGIGQRDIPFYVSIYDESNQLPNLKLLGGGLEPGIEVGTHFQLSGTEFQYFGIQVCVGGFNHRHVSKARYVDIELLYRKKINRIFIQPSLGIMINRHEFPNTNYQIEKGVPQEIKNVHINPIPSLGIRAGYNLGSEVKPINAFFKYEFGIEIGFTDPIPILPHTFFHLGLETTLFKTQK